VCTLRLSHGITVHELQSSRYTVNVSNQGRKIQKFYIHVGGSVFCPILCISFLPFPLLFRTSLSLFPLSFSRFKVATQIQLRDLGERY